MQQRYVLTIILIDTSTMHSYFKRMFTKGTFTIIIIVVVNISHHNFHHHEIVHHALYILMNLIIFEALEGLRKMFFFTKPQICCLNANFYFNLDF